VASTTGSRWRATVLVVENDPRQLRAVRGDLQGAGYAVATASTGDEAVRFFEERDPDLVLLELGLPDISGFEVLRKIRHLSAVPIIILSVLSGDEDKVRALEAGADDYVTKPFSPVELLARVQVAIRRSRRHIDLPAASRVLEVGALRLDERNRLAYWRGIKIDLSPIEYRLLWVLASNADRLVTRSHLEEMVWGSSEHAGADRLKSAIRRLRRQLDASGAGSSHIVARRGFGYSFVSRPNE